VQIRAPCPVTERRRVRRHPERCRAEVEDVGARGCAGRARAVDGEQVTVARWFAISASRQLRRAIAMPDTRFLNLYVPCSLCGMLIEVEVAITKAGNVAVLNRELCPRELGSDAHPPVSEVDLLNATRLVLERRGLLGSRDRDSP
jgi:hypothetical protein